MIGSKMYLFVLTCFSTIALDVGLVSSLNSSLILKLVNHGDSVTLNCYLGDNIGNNWIYNNAAIIPTKSYKLLRNNSLEIKNVDYIHQGIYECLDHTRSVIVDYYLQIEGDCWDRSTSVVGENDINISVIGEVPSADLIVTKGTQLALRCQTQSDAPIVEMWWLLNDERISVPMETCGNLFNYTLGSTASFASVTLLNITVDSDAGSVVCVRRVHGSSTEGQAELKYFSHEFNVESSNKLLKGLTAVIAGVLLLMSILAVYFLRKGVTGSYATSNIETSADGSANLTVVRQMKRIHTGKKASTQKTNMEKKAMRRSSKDKKCPKPPRQQLRFTTKPTPTCDKGYYSSMEQNSTAGNVIQRQHVSLVVEIKVGTVYRRWMGTIHVPSMGTKCVFVTNVSGKSEYDDLNWSEYVKRVLELPSCKNLVRSEVVCIDKADILLIQEHLICVTLAEYLESSSSLPAFSSLKFIQDILNGMQIIHAYGLLHPGLSASKILITGQDCCKLYDFALADYASKKVAYIKSKRLVSLNDFAPESLNRNEYVRASDMWSTAVVIWTVLTKGSSPFQPEDTTYGESSIKSKENSELLDTFQDVRYK
ncbi:uncharacterized protein [Apostichopus japonicus]|uniref:uncharacterized protein isoform X3 n=1 Tax=Stichopus japonicus TaxID=307972 RepID=UPI003AB832DF